MHAMRSSAVLNGDSERPVPRTRLHWKISMANVRSARPVRRADASFDNLVMVPAWPGQPTCEELALLASTGQRPRTDYVELARALEAEIMDMEYLEKRATAIARLVATCAGTPPAQVTEAFLRRKQYAHVVARADRLGLPLALLLKLARAKPNVVLISVWLSRPKKAIFLRPLRVHTHLHAIVNYGTTQMTIAADRLKVPPSKLYHVPQPVDELFWRPTDAPPADVISAVGSEARDYPTLLEAVRGLPVRTEVAVGTTVFKTDDPLSDLAPGLHPLAEAPPNVEVHEQLSHTDLRALYARSRFVVVPLQDVDFDAGVTCIAEAMAMGKAVVVTRSRGQVDLVKEGETGLYVPPGDARALREAIEHLLSSPEEAARMGRAGRAVAKSRLALDGWVSRVVELTLGP
jgi:glycosyltransferase involved in cell wall biosynthesis